MPFTAYFWQKISNLNFPPRCALNAHVIITFEFSTPKYPHVQSFIDFGCDYDIQGFGGADGGSLVSMGFPFTSAQLIRESN
jgi:hypothetical protein